MIKFQYVMFHIPTSKSFTQEAEFLSEVDFLRNLNRWNKHGKHNYIYYSKEHIAPQHHARGIAEVPNG